MVKYLVFPSEAEAREFSRLAWSFKTDRERPRPGDITRELWDASTNATTLRSSLVVPDRPTNIDFLSAFVDPTRLKTEEDAERDGDKAIPPALDGRGGGGGSSESLWDKTVNFVKGVFGG